MIILIYFCFYVIIFNYFIVVSTGNKKLFAYFLIVTGNKEIIRVNLSASIFHAPCKCTLECLFLFRNVVLYVFVSAHVVVPTLPIPDINQFLVHLLVEIKLAL